MKKITEMGDDIPDFNSSRIENYMAFYLESEAGDDFEIKVHVRHKLIPASLKDKFIIDMEDKIKSKTLTGDDIDNFLRDNTDEK